MIQEQAIQEAKIKKIQNALAIKSGWSSWEDMWNDYFHDEHKLPFDSKEDESNFKQKIIQVAIEYSSSQLEATQKQSEKWETNYLKVVSDKGIEISNLKDKLEAKDREIEKLKQIWTNKDKHIDELKLEVEAKDKEIEELKKQVADKTEWIKLGYEAGLQKEQYIIELKSQLQQATASSGERGDEEALKRIMGVYKIYNAKGELVDFLDSDLGKEMFTEVELLLSTHPSTKRLGLEDIQKIIDDWFKSSNENTTHLAHLILQFVVPSEHTEVNKKDNHLNP